MGQFPGTEEALRTAHQEVGHLGRESRCAQYPPIEDRPVLGIFLGEQFGDDTHLLRGGEQ